MCQPPSLPSQGKRGNLGNLLTSSRILGTRYQGTNECVPYVHELIICLQKNRTFWQNNEGRYKCSHFCGGDENLPLKALPYCRDMGRYTSYTTFIGLKKHFLVVDDTQRCLKKWWVLSSRTSLVETEEGVSKYLFCIN